jgi:hypothetical protein
MNTQFEMNQHSALTDATLDGVVGGSIFSRIFYTALNNPIATDVVGFVTPWGQVSHAASSAVHAVASVVSHFKFW